MPYSVPDCRNYSNFPNNAIDIQLTETYTVQQFDSRAAGAPVDSRAAGAPVDSRTAANIPLNCRVGPSGTSGFLLLETGTGFFELENGSGFILLES